MKNSVWIVISALLLAACNPKPEFTRIITWDKTDSYYGETILVKHTPKNALEQIKMMIAYYDSVGMSLTELKSRRDITMSSMWFIKDTKSTRRYYWEGEEDVQTNPNETFIGKILFVEVDDENEFKVSKDSAKWRVAVYINLGDEPDAEYTGVHFRCYPLYDESDSNWWEHHKDSTMLQYDEPIWKRECTDGRVINYFKKLQGDKLK